MNRQCKSQKISLILFCFVFIAGVLLRFYHLDVQSLWSDELFTVAAALDVGEGKNWLDFTPKVIPELTHEDSFITWKAADNTPPLFDLMLMVWAKIFGESDFALRSLPAVLGSLASAVLFFGLRRSLGVWPALCAAALVAFSPKAVEYSQEVRAYTLALLLAAVVAVRIINHVLDEGDPDQRSGFARMRWTLLFMVLLAYAHYTGLFLAGMLAAVYVVLVALPRRRWREIAQFLLVPAAIAPWMWLSQRAFFHSSAGGYRWWNEPPAVLSNMLPRTLDFYLPEFSQLLVCLLGISLFAALTARYSTEGWLFSFKEVKQRASDKHLLLTLGYLAALLLLFAYSVYNANTSKMWHLRYFLVALPVLYCIFALLFAQVNHLRGFMLTVTTLLLGASVFSTGQYLIDDQPVKPQYREASQFIAEHIKDDAIIVLGWRSNASYYRHYLDKYLPETGKRYTYMPVSHKWEIDELCKGGVFSGRQVFVFKMFHQPRYGKMVAACPGANKIRVSNLRGLVAGEFQFDLQDGIGR